MLRIAAAHAIGGYRLALTLTDGTVIERDVSGLLEGPVFAPIRDVPSLFSDVRVLHGSVAWPGDLDLDPDVLIWGGPAPSDPAAQPVPSLTLAAAPA
jgi:hypothetical protein